jgi:hypothetical protein
MEVNKGLVSNIQGKSKTRQRNSNKTYKENDYSPTRYRRGVGSDQGTHVQASSIREQ